jgi:hypothetical protein
MHVLLDLQHSQGPTWHITTNIALQDIQDEDQSPRAAIALLSQIHPKKDPVGKHFVKSNSPKEGPSRQTLWIWTAQSERSTAARKESGKKDIAYLPTVTGLMVLKQRQQEHLQDHPHCTCLATHKM